MAEVEGSGVKEARDSKTSSIGGLGILVGSETEHTHLLSSGSGKMPTLICMYMLILIVLI